MSSGPSRSVDPGSSRQILGCETPRSNRGKGSWAMFISSGLGGPKRILKTNPAKGKCVHIRILRSKLATIMYGETVVDRPPCGSKLSL